MIKPDGVQRRLVGNIISRFEAKGYLLKALKLTTPSKEMLEEHYRELKDKPFFPKLVSYMSSGPVVAMVKLVVSSFPILYSLTHCAVVTFLRIAFHFSQFSFV